MANVGTTVGTVVLSVGTTVSVGTVVSVGDTVSVGVVASVGSVMAGPIESSATV